MPPIDDLCRLLEELAPDQLAEDWDNVGLLVGDRNRAASRLMTCLTLTPDSVAEAVDEHADLVVTHHPLPFRPLNRITRDTPVGRMLLDLIAGQVAVYSRHTAFDSAREGINQQLAVGIGLQNVEPLMHESADDPLIGAGRCGVVREALTLSDVANRLKGFLGLSQIRVIGESQHRVQRVAVACGSGGSLLEAARQRECHCLVTGEASFHACLEAEASGVSMVLCGHYASERFALEWLANHLANQLPGVTCWASRRERDPFHWI